MPLINLVVMLIVIGARYALRRGHIELASLIMLAFCPVIKS